MVVYTGIEFKDFILGFRQSTFLCTTLKCIEKFRIPFIKSGIPASNLGSSEAWNPAKFAACVHHVQTYHFWSLFHKVFNLLNCTRRLESRQFLIINLIS